MKSKLPWVFRRVSSSLVIIIVLLFASFTSIGASVFFWPAAAEAKDAQKAILHRHDPRVREAIAVQDRHTKSLMSIPNVVGTGVAIGPDGLPAIKVFTSRHGISGIPERLESIPVQVEVTGMVVALGDTTARYRPAPIGVSTGHPLITAGTIGARVKDASGRVFALSNNHVYANQNNATIGDRVLQPGPYDGAINNDYYKIGTLFDFQPIDFSFFGQNYMDAAVAISTPENLGNSTLPDGYGTPSSVTKLPSIGLSVQKYGRTTSLTHGQIEEINVFVEVCYEQWGSICIKSAYFYDQISISSSTGGFSAGGDSGSLIVTDDPKKNPVGLLFAGSSTRTFGNRIDLVLNRFGVRVDGPVPGDFNGDGEPDILWRNTSTGRTTIWYMEGATWSGGYADVLPTVSGSDWAIVGVADFNDDGSPDLLWRNATTGRTTIWFMDGATWSGNYADVVPAVSSTDWAIVGVADFNNDTKPDLLWRNASTGRTTIWYMDGATWSGNYADVVPAVSSTDWAIVGVADFNNDTRPDLLWRNASTGRTTIWYMDGATWTGNYADVLPAVSGSDWQIVSIRDFNSDGKPDLLWRNTSTYRTTVWYMDGATWSGAYADILPTVNDPNWIILGR